MSRLLRLLVSLSLFAVLVALIISPTPAVAKSTAGDPNPPCIPTCPTCGPPDCIYYLSSSPANSRVSLTEGNFIETYAGPQVKSAFGATLRFDLIYNTYNADGSRASIDTVMGYGWTHTYNDFLFSQRGDMFRMGPDGRITRFALSSGGTYVTTPGYFETLVNNLDGSFTITTKYQTKYRYQSIPGTAFLVDGPVLRLTSITDRNNNVTTLTYTAGDLTSVTDTYGRSLTLTYNSNHHLTSVSDPLNHVTSFSYNLAGCLLTTIKDPLLKTTSFTYNALFQMTSKTDRDGRLFTMQYRNGLPYAELDGKGGRVFLLTNPSNWAVDATQLAAIMMRVYIPSTTSKTDGRGNVWTYSYDSNAHPQTVKAPDGATTTYTYDPATLQIESIKDANLHTTSYVYDSEGNITQRTDANGNITLYTYDPVFNQLTSVTDPQHRVTTYTYDSRGNRLSETDRLMHTQSWTYDSHGNVLTFTDKDSNTTTYVYDSNGNLHTVTDALNDVTGYTDDIVGNKLSMTDADGNPTTYQYDALNRLVSQTDALTDTKHYSYDNEGDLGQVIDENNDATTYIYDLRRRLLTITDAVQKNTTYTYDANNNPISMTDRNVHTTQYAYDVQNRLVRTTDALGHTSQRVYDLVGNLISETDANGHTTTYQYDPLNRRTTKTDTLNEITTWGYDLTGLPGCPVPPGPCSGPTLGSNEVTSQTDANGKVIYYAYDGLDRKIIEIHKQNGTAYDIVPGVDAVTYLYYDPNSNLTKVTEPDGNITAYAYDKLNRKKQMVQVQTKDTTGWTYDPFGNILTITWPNGNVTIYTYDALNRKKTEDDSDGPVSAWIYDAVGNILSTTDGDGNPTSYTYDPLNRRMTMTDALGKVTQYFYDFVGNLVQLVDRKQHSTSYSYDKVNRCMTITDAQPATTSFQYDPVGNLTAITDANNHTTTFAYDKVNRKTSETYPDPPPHNTVTWIYDRIGNVTSRTNQKAQTTAYTYSDLYFLTSRAYASGTDSFTYDLSGRVLTANTSRGTGWNETFAYDGANRLLQGVQNGRTISYMYNIPERMRILTYPGGRTITEQWDSRPRLLTINDRGSTPIVQYAYDPANNVLTRGYRNGTMATYTYNANNWVCSLNHTSSANLIVGFSYAYDNEGNKFYEQKLHELSDSEAYAYDVVYRLTDYQAGTLASSPPPNCPPNAVDITVPVTQTAYNLDKLSNWNSKTTDMVTQTRAHSPSNEISKIDTTPILSDYDGNTGDDGTNLYSYDEENRLVKVVNKSTFHVLGQYQYDTFSRRVSKTDNFGVQTFYYYDGWRTIEEQSSTGLTEATYVFGNYLDEALTMDRGGATYYYHKNALWSVFALTDSNGKGVEGYQYDAYGYQTLVLPGPDGVLDFDDDDVYLPGAQSSVGNPFLFTGQRYDSEVGLYYYKKRFYSPYLGRFLTRDPIDYEESPNLYMYALSDPIRYLDPHGERTGNMIGSLIQTDCTDTCTDTVIASLIGTITTGDPYNGYVCYPLYDMKCYCHLKAIDLAIGLAQSFVSGEGGNIAEGVEKEIATLKGLGYQGRSIPIGSEESYARLLDHPLPDLNSLEAPHCSQCTCILRLYITGHGGRTSAFVNPDRLAATRFCDGCIIMLAGCQDGVDREGNQVLANATGCRVEGSLFNLPAGHIPSPEELIVWTDPSVAHGGW